MLFGESPWSASEVIALIARLPEGSMFVAQHQDPEHWREYLDITPDYYLGAGLFNAMNDNTRATGNWKNGKAPKFEPWPTPQVLVERRKLEESKKTVAGLFRLFAGGMAVPDRGIIEEE